MAQCHTMLESEATAYFSFCMLEGAPIHHKVEQAIESQVQITQYTAELAKTDFLQERPSMLD